MIGLPAAAPRRPAQIAARRGLIAIVLVAAVATLLPVGAATAQRTTSDEIHQVVFILARKLDDGRVEFALRVRPANTSAGWGRGSVTVEYPRARFFPTDAEVGRWLRSSPLDLTVGPTRIVARRLADGRIEFATEQRHPTSGEWGSREWGAFQQPDKRMFPYDTAAVGEWLQSSGIGLREIRATPWTPHELYLFGHLHTDGPCAELPDHAPQDWCLTPADENTIRLFNCHTGGSDAPDFVDTPLVSYFPYRDGRPVKGTRPLHVEVGTRIEVHNTCRSAADLDGHGGLEILWIITGFTGIVDLIPIYEGATAYGITACQTSAAYWGGYPEPRIQRPWRTLWTHNRGFSSPRTDDGRYYIDALSNATGGTSSTGADCE